MYRKDAWKYTVQVSDTTGDAQKFYCWSQKVIGVIAGKFPKTLFVELFTIIPRNQFIEPKPFSSTETNG